VNGPCRNRTCNLGLKREAIDVGLCEFPGGLARSGRVARGRICRLRDTFRDTLRRHDQLTTYPPEATTAFPAESGVFCPSPYQPASNATGHNLRTGPAAYEIRSRPERDPVRQLDLRLANPFNTTHAFYAGDTGGAIEAHHVDIYDWQGRTKPRRLGRTQRHGDTRIDTTSREPGRAAKQRRRARSLPGGTAASPRARSHASVPTGPRSRQAQRQRRSGSLSPRGTSSTPARIPYPTSTTAASPDSGPRTTAPARPRSSSTPPACSDHARSTQPTSRPAGNPDPDAGSPSTPTPPTPRSSWRASRSTPPATAGRRCPPAPGHVGERNHSRTWAMAAAISFGTPPDSDPTTPLLCDPGFLGCPLASASRLAQWIGVHGTP
jgi:3D (Asp-Asp-Asp) domain-containing protein